MKNNKGFTLIELIIVIAIIGILAAIAVPTIFNAQTKAKESATKAMASNVLAAGQSLYAQFVLDGTAIPAVDANTLATDLMSSLPPEWTFAAGNPVGALIARSAKFTYTDNDYVVYFRSNSPDFGVEYTFDALDADGDGVAYVNVGGQTGGGEDVDIP